MAETIMTSTDSPMAVDSQLSDQDSETKSLGPSVTDYPIYWGRRYHKFKEGSYPYPNDEVESERLDFTHSILKRLHGGRLVFAPLRDPRKILDIGTGTGIWPIELADSNLFPNAKIIGTDLSPIQPNIVPSNVSFEIQDCSDTDWERPLASIDYIHSRILMGSLYSFPSFIRNARRYLRPGTGWLECHEVLSTPCSDDNSIPKHWPVTEWEDILHRASMRMEPQRPLRIADNLKSWMHQAGFVDIQEHISKIPINPWPRDKELKRIGRWWADNLLDGMSAFSYKPLGPDGMGWSRDEIEVFLASVRNAIIDHGVHSYQKLYVVYGRRPNHEEERQMQMTRDRLSKKGVRGTAKGHA